MQMEEQPEKEKKKQCILMGTRKQAFQKCSQFLDSTSTAITSFISSSYTSYHHTLDHYRHQEGILWDISMSGTGLAPNYSYSPHIPSSQPSNNSSISLRHPIQTLLLSPSIFPQSLSPLVTSLKSPAHHSEAISSIFCFPFIPLTCENLTSSQTQL